MAIVDKRDAPDLIRSHGYTLSLRNGKLGFQISDSLDAPMLDWEQNGQDLRDGLWHHVAATVQRASTNGVQLYVDGQVIATFDPTPASGIDLWPSAATAAPWHAPELIPGIEA